MKLSQKAPGSEQLSGPWVMAVWTGPVQVAWGLPGPIVPDEGVDAPDGTGNSRAATIDIAKRMRTVSRRDRCAWGADLAPVAAAVRAIWDLLVRGRRRR